MVPTQLPTRADQYYRELLAEAAHDSLLAQTQHAALSVSLSRIQWVTPGRQLQHIVHYARFLLSSLATVAFGYNRQS